MRSPADRVTSGAERRTSSSVAGSRAKPSSSSSRTARSSRKRVVVEDGRRHRADDARLEICPPAVRVARLAAAHRDRDRVEGEVPRPEVVLDRAGKGREVDRLLVAVHHDPPGAVTLREGERRAAEAPRVPTRGLPAARGTRRRGRARAARAAGRAPRRRRPTPPRSPTISRTRSSIAHQPLRAARARVQARGDLVPDRAGDPACSSIRTPSPTSVTGVPTGSLSESSTASASIEIVPTTRRRSPVDRDLRPGHVPPEPVRVPDGDDADPGRPLGDEATPVPGALARPRGA